MQVSIIGGCGHVGLPLGVKFALAGLHTTLVDIDDAAINKVNSGIFPFLENGGDSQLKQALEKNLSATSDISTVKSSDVVVFVIGTPVDEHLNPKLSDVFKIFDSYSPFLKDDSLIIMRSTLFPGTMEHLYNRIKQTKLNVNLAFCPERVAQGYALDEIDSLPQIISAFDDKSFKLAYDVFSKLAPCIIKLNPLEAEITKLMANSWRYLEFAIANQFYMIAENSGVDFYKIYEAIRYKYPRASGYKSPGFAAGPCLFKDTMQLASFYDNKFGLGHSAMLVNEGLASHVADKAANQISSNKMDLWGKTVGILGMTFKANNDDIRESLSFKVKKDLEFRGARVVFNDPYLEGSTDINEIDSISDILILGTPHSIYRNHKFNKDVIDVWSFFSKPNLEVIETK